MRGSVRTLFVVVITALVVTGTSGTTIAAGATPAPDTASGPVDAPASVQNQTANETETPTPTDSANDSTTNDSTANESTANESADGEVNVTLGRQLSTVLTVTSEEVQGEVTNASLTAAFQQANETQRAELLAARQSELAARTNATLSEYRSLVSEAEAGNLTTGEFASRLALINARANQLQASWRRVARLSEDVSALELDAAGYDTATTADARESLNVVTGPGANALLRGFTTGDAGNVSLETRGGLAIGVSKGEERVREFEREGDNSTNLTVTHSTARETARAALSNVNGTWQVTSSAVDGDDGVYEFTFRLAGNTTGEAEVTVDGSSGTVIELEEEIGDDEGPPEGVPGGPPDDRGPPEDRDENDTDDESELTLLVVDGTPTANATVTVAVRDDGESVSNATVRLNDRVVDTTDADGTVTVQLPDGGDAELTATAGDREAELEFELGEEDREDRLTRDLNASGTVTNGTVTLTVTFDGEGVSGVRAIVDDSVVGITGSDGTVSFPAEEGTPTVEIRKGQFEATLTFEIDNGTVTTTDTEVSERDERGEGPPDDERGEGPPDDERGEGPPDDERGEGPPDDERGEGPPDDERGEGPPDDERGEGPPDDEDEGEGPSDEDERGPPDDERGEGPPDGEETETEDDEETETEAEETETEDDEETDTEEDDEETEAEDDEETETEAEETIQTPAFDG